MWYADGLLMPDGKARRQRIPRVCALTFGELLYLWPCALAAH